jgi:UDP-GlcNAc:undecaprenyl-phosphate GlcNAc-1-phosphate transferase
VVSAAAVSTAVAVILVPVGLQAMRASGWTRPNWRGTDVPFPAGAIAVPAAVAAAGAADPGVLAIGLATALAGLVDDLADAPPRGLRGHAAAALRGRPSTGVLKAATTFTTAAVVLGDLLAAAVVTLAAHAFNLLDLRPGRATKGFLLLVAALAATTTAGPLSEIGLFAGPLLVLGAYDLRERAMLGDTGSTLLGAMAGLYLVAVIEDPAGRLAAVAALTAVALYGELRSLSALIEQVPPLRSLDWLGRKDRHA